MAIHKGSIDPIVSDFGAALAFPSHVCSLVGDRASMLVRTLWLHRNVACPSDIFEDIQLREAEVLSELSALIGPAGLQSLKYLFPDESPDFWHALVSTIAAKAGPPVAMSAITF